MALPFPRLELRWRPSNKKLDGDMHASYNWACDYIMVLYPKTTIDIRSSTYGKDGEKYHAKNVQYVLNTSYRSSDREPFAGDTPYREHSHACWDGATLGLPVYSIYKGKSKQIEITEQHKIAAIGKMVQ